MSTRRLVQAESSGLQYDQAGFDIFEKDNSDIGGEDHLIVYPGTGTDSGNIAYAGNEEPNAHWIGIHNCGTEVSGETISIQAESLVGDDLTMDPSSTFDYDTARYIEITSGDIIYGKFSSVGILKTDSVIYKDRVRLIRGV